MQRMKKLQVEVNMNDWHSDQQDYSGLTRMFISIDRITKRRECNIYSDDGRGNGDLILSFEME